MLQKGFSLYFVIDRGQGLCLAAGRLSILRYVKLVVCDYMMECGEEESKR